jgi:hypothetical protein
MLLAMAVRAQTSPAKWGFLGFPAKGKAQVLIRRGTAGESRLTLRPFKSSNFKRLQFT